EDVPTRFYQARAGGDGTGRIGNVLEHFHAGDDVERGRRFFSERFGADEAVIDLVPALEEVQAGDAERLFREIDAGHVSTDRRHAFGQNAAAAADVQHLLAGQCGLAVDPAQAQRVDLVQGFELGGGVPPAVGEVAELLQFCGIGV